MIKKLLVLIILILFILPLLYQTGESPVNAYSPTLRYVSTNGVDEGDCTDPNSPCNSIQYAINNSFSGDTILVSEGTYNYPTKKPCHLAIICSINKQLTLKGGYTKQTWNGPDPVNHPSIIDGAGLYRGVAVVGVVVDEIVTINTHLEMTGFTIQDSVALGSAPNNDYSPDGVGGGMLVQNASIHLEDIIFRNNQAIGANTGSGAGGQADGAGLRIENPFVDTTSILQRVVFENNKSTGGQGPDRGGIAFGALYSYKAKVIIEDSKFFHNIAQAGSSTGDGYLNGLHADALGGGIAIMEGNVTIKNVEVTENKVYGGNGKNFGGGGYGGGIFIEDFGARVTSVWIYDSSIVRNQAIAGSGATGGNGAGGGIDVDSSTITIDRTSIIQNSVIGGNGNFTNDTAGPGAGGGIYIFKVRSGDFRANLSNVIIANNYADQGKIGTGSQGNGGGGGAVIHGVDATIHNSTIVANELGSNLILGQGVLVQNWPSPDNTDAIYSGNLILSNSIVANHQKETIPAIIVQKNSLLTLHYGLFSGNSKDINSDGQPVTNGTIIGLDTFENVNDVGFVAPEEPFLNFHLRQNSVTRDKGGITQSLLDIDMQPRVYGSAVDLGADEYHPFNLSIRPGDTLLFIDWERNIQIFNGIDLFHKLTIQCENDARPPDQISCGKTLDLGDQTNITLTGLTNFITYIIKVDSFSLENELIASSIATQAIPTSNFVFIPIIAK